MDPIRGQTATMSPRTSTSEGIERSPDTTARLRAYLDAIPFLCSAPFSLTMMNSVIKSGSRLPKTTDAHSWRQLFSSGKSKMGYSISFSRHPLPANSKYVWRGTCDAPSRKTNDNQGPTKPRTCPRTVASRLASPLYLLSTATHSLRIVSRSHVRRKTRMDSDPSSSSTLNWLHDLVQPTTRVKIRGNTPFSNNDCKKNHH